MSDGSDTFSSSAVGIDSILGFVVAVRWPQTRPATSTLEDAS
jgi:hypothetical protein